MQLWMEANYSIYFAASTQMVSLLGNTFSSSVGVGNSGQPLMGNGHQNSMGLANDLNSNDTSPYDINEFPQLTSRPNSSGGPQGQLGRFWCLCTYLIFALLLVLTIILKMYV